MVKKADQEVQRKLELPRRAAIQPKMPALYVVVGSDGFHEHAPRGRPCVACDSVPADGATLTAGVSESMLSSEAVHTLQESPLLEGTTGP